ncbi:hypothetical protein, partial [Actinophytocola sp.]|uniref:hypothetical protein n=1 Tax=Actinophytocola sp. TaxID=1872138 RepID=UPI00389AC1A6
MHSDDPPNVLTLTRLRRTQRDARRFHSLPPGSRGILDQAQRSDDIRGLVSQRRDETGQGVPVAHLIVDDERSFAPHMSGCQELGATNPGL